MGPGGTSRRALRAVAALAAFALLGGCTVATRRDGKPLRRSEKSTRPRFAGTCAAPTPPAPATGYHVSGCIVTADGRPVAAPVAAVGREMTFGDFLLVATGLVFSFGTACFYNDCDLGNGPGAPRRGGADGTFGVDIPESARTGRYKAVVVAPGAASSVEVYFGVKKAQRAIVLPPLLAWQPRLRVVRQGAYVVPTFDRLPGETVGRYDLVLNDGHSDIVTVEGVRSGERVDARFFQDVKGSFQVRTDAFIGPESAGAYRSAPVAWHPGGPAASRGAACRYLAPTGTVASYGKGYCDVTDGNLLHSYSDLSVPRCDAFPKDEHPPCAEGDTWFEIDLGRVTRVGTVVVHGQPSSVRVEVSNDRARWRIAGHHDYDRSVGRPFAVPVRRGTTARYVRVVATHNIEGATEVSVYP